MALRPDRDYNLIDDISHFWTDAAADAENGGVASMKTAGSGVSLDDAANVVEYKADPSGAKPMGVLLQNIKHYAGTRVFPNMQNGDIQPGDKCTLVRKGWIVTKPSAALPDGWRDRLPCRGRQCVSHPDDGLPRPSSFRDEQGR